MVAVKPVEAQIERYEPELNTGCWLWTGATNPHGYGNFMSRRRIILAHRASYEARVGPIPPGLQLCHRCDTPACINPDHLFPGTQTDNMRDAARKRRLGGQRGERHCKAVLTEAAVRQIRSDTRSLPVIGRAHGIHHTTVLRIKQRKSWAHVA